MALGECKCLLVVGTSEEHPKLLVWNISTNTYLYHIPLNGYVSVRALKLSSSGKHAAAVAVMENATQHLLFLDLQQQRIAAVAWLPNSEVTVNDICFVINCEYTILGCGQNFMGEWQYKNGLLNHRRYNLDTTQDLSDIKAAGIIFYSIIFIGDMAITSASDGYLYVWKEGSLVKRQNAHPGHAVLSLYTAPNSKIFASGGTNGRVVIWKIWSSLIIQHQGEYPK
jgi:WD40 repeat protein